MARFHTPSLALPTPDLTSRTAQRLLMPSLLALMLLLPLLLFTGGVGVRQGKGTNVVVNEVYLDTSPHAEWVELLNTTPKSISLTGWQLTNQHGAVARLSGQLAPGILTVVSPEVGGWNPGGDVVTLLSSDNQIIDSLGWGKIAALTNTPILQSAKAGRSLTRNPQGLDSDTTADWIMTQPSPGTQSPVSLSVGLHRILFAATNYISFMAGLLLWASFLLIGLSARRFEALTGQRAYWMAMVIAPVGIVIYNAIQSYAFFTAGAMSNCSRGLAFGACQQGWAFTPLLLSAIAMAYVSYRFYTIAHRILDLK